MLHLSNDRVIVYIYMRLDYSLSQLGDTFIYCHNTNKKYNEIIATNMEADVYTDLAMSGCKCVFLFYFIFI